VVGGRHLTSHRKADPAGRRSRAGVILACLAVAGGGLSTALGSPGTAAAADKPNVVVIMTDDQTLADLAVMPNTGALLGAGGLTFNRYYVSYPLCCPSRATYLTGRYTHNHDVLSNSPPNGGYEKLSKAHILPVWLQDAGYRTIHVGKYVNGYGRAEPPDVPPGWSEWYGATNATSGLYWGYTLNEFDHTGAPGVICDPFPPAEGTLCTYGMPHVEDPAFYQSDVYAFKAADAIERAADGDAPFFLNVGFSAPHTEQQFTGQLHQGPRPAPRHATAFSTTPLPRPPSFNERNFSDKPSFLRTQLRRIGRGAIATMTVRYQRRLASLLSVDEAVSRIIAALQTAGELDSTYVFFTSDNGFFQGEYRIQRGKILPYEPAIHVPLLVRGPGIPPGAVSQELVANVDLAPTILSIAGASPSKTVDGRSLLAFATNPARRSRRPILLESGIRASNLDPDGIVAVASAQTVSTPTYTAVRTNRYLLVRYANGARELYDMFRDPNQLRSAHGNRRYRQVRRRLAPILNRLDTCSGAGCRQATVPLPRPLPKPARRRR
jgi:N-acetylglucosamine-6-sulfatase